MSNIVLLFANVLLLLKLSHSTPVHGIMDPSQCGRGGPRSSKILSGEDAIPHEFPWLVSVKSNGNHFCGGFVVASKFVISAAHCFFRKYNPNLSYNDQGVALASSIVVSLGQHDLTLIGAQDTNATVDRITLHPDFEKGGHLSNDIAIIEITNKMNWGSKLSPICLPGADHNKSFGVGDSVTVAGWGNTNCHNSNIRPSNTLKKVSIPIWKDEDCLKAYEEASYDFTRNDYLCAGDEKKDSSKGDSGSALMIQQNNQWTAIGIVSSGRFMCEDRVPGVYTNLGYYTDWIQSQINLILQ